MTWWVSWGLGKGLLISLGLLVGGFLLKGLLVYLKLNDADYYDYAFNVCFSFIVAF